jgi:peptidoglycan/xylan/chitin deacetylase (PgdA/CDA1 family)
MNYIQYLTNSGLAIFLFHGVVEKSHYAVRNYNRKHLEKDYFYKELKELQKNGMPMTMDDVIKHHESSISFPPYAFTVTFDDGFENNYSIAAPILSDLQIPATFYLTTSFIENNTMSWIDRIEFCLEHTPRGELRFRWDHPKAHAFHDRITKRKLLDYLRTNVKQSISIDLEELVQDVFSQCKMTPISKSGDPLDLKMNWKQVRELKNGGLFTIGGHSHHHVNLAYLSAENAEHEIATSIGLLRKNTDIEAEHYSYPEGLDYCYSDETIQILKRCGIVCAPTAINGTNTVDVDLFHLKRIAVV